MPASSRVDRCYQKVKKEDHSEGSAARICQSATGQALSTGQPPKKRLGKRLTVGSNPARVKAIRAKYKHACSCKNCKQGKNCCGK